MRTITRARSTTLLAAVVLTGTASCGNSTSHATMPGMTHTTARSTAMATMPPMTDMPSGNGLAAESGGYRFTAPSSQLGTSFQFRILGSNGKPVTRFQTDQTKLMHFYLVRTDLTGYQHVHPVMAPGGTWTAPLAATRPGTYRVYASFTPTGGQALVLGRQVTTPGTPTRVPLPAAVPTTTVDGYTLRLAGAPMAGMEHTLTITITKGGRPVTDLQPYLGNDAHLTAFHAGDLAFTHLHPEGRAVAGRLSFHALLAQAGKYRLFIQFQTGSRLHTAAITLTVAG